MTPPFVFGYAVWSGLLGVLPIPFVDDWFAQMSRTGMLRRIGESRHVDIDDAALTILAGGHDAYFHKSLAVVGIARIFRKLSTPLVILRRSEEALYTLQLGIVFDHYCRVTHVGGAIGAADANRLRNALHAAITKTRGATIEVMLRERLVSFMELSKRGARKLSARLALSRAPVAETLAAEIVLEGDVARTTAFGNYTARLNRNFEAAWKNSSTAIDV